MDNFNSLSKEEKVIKIKNLIDNPGREEAYFCLLKEMGDLKTNYADYMITEPIDSNKELKRLPDADYELTTAILTMLLREDHFINGSFERKQREGIVEKVLQHMIDTI